MTPTDLIVPIVVALLGGGGIWALFKVRPEAGMVVVQAAEQVVIMQRGTIVDLTAQIAACEKKADDACASVERMSGEMRDLREELLVTRRERDEAMAQNIMLKDRVQELERKVSDLEQREERLASEIRGITPPHGTPET